MTREVNVMKIEEETFRDTTERGVKQGITKNGIDKGLEKVTKPVAEQLQALMKKVHPDAGLADNAARDFVNFVALNGAAEIAKHSSAITTKIPGLKGITEEKTDAFARYLRGYSGEQVGTKTANATFAMAPVLASLMSNPDLKAVLASVNGEAPQLPDGNNLAEQIEQLTDDEEEEDG